MNAFCEDLGSENQLARISDSRGRIRGEQRKSKGEQKERKKME